MIPGKCRHPWKTPGTKFFEKQLICDSLAIHPFEVEQKLCAILQSGAFRHFGE